MKAILKKCLIAAVMLLATLSIAHGQGKVYTRKVKLQDFSVRTTKVVLSGHSFLEAAVKEEISTRWRISPFEFCTSEDYETLKKDSNLYFIRLVQKDGVAFMLLSKGGRKDSEDNLKKPFDVVSIPIASVESPTGRELMFMGAFVDILQLFVEDAMISDRTAYAGLARYGTGKLTGKRVYVNTDEVDSLYQNGESDVLLGITIAPVMVGIHSSCYKMLIAADTHELYYFKKTKYRGPKDVKFTDEEIKQFDRRNGVIAR